MKNLGSIILVFFSLTVFGQKNIQPTSEFQIVGKVKAEKTIKLSDLSSYSSKKIKDVEITNHLGEKKGTAKKLKGILLTDLLKNIEFQAESPKILSEFFLTFVGSDGYKAVFSWNEIFNSPTGNSLYLITEKDGKKIEEIEERMIIIVPSDFKTGRRYVKGLSKIIVERVQ